MSLIIGNDFFFISLHCPQPFFSPLPYRRSGVPDQAYLLLHSRHALLIVMSLLQVAYE